MKTLVNYFCRILFVLLMCLGFFMSCEEIQPIPVTSVSLNATSIELIEGTTQTLVATISPSNADNNKVIWTSSDPSVASVTDGVVTAINEGSATIAVKTEDGGKTDVCEVIVVAKVYFVQSVMLDITSVEIMEGEAITLTPSILPENATNKEVIWSSSDKTIAIVEEGKVQTLKEGETIITVTTVDGNKTATCKVIVQNDPMTEPIVFADPIMEGMCLDAFDANNDGELSYKEAASVTDLSNMELTNPGYVSFDEFQYFINVKEIPDGYFSFHDSLKSIILPKNIEYVGKNAFGGTALESIALPEGVTYLGANAFYSCLSLKSVVMSPNIQHIESYTFASCINLKSISLPQNLQSIKSGAFYECQSLENIILPETLTMIGDGIEDNPDPESVFYNCTSLKSITIPKNVTYIGNTSFGCCTNLAEVVILGAIKSIQRQTFTGCKKLTTIVIPESLQRVEDQAFKNCENLSKVEIGDIKSWCSVTFSGPKNDAFTPYANHPMWYGADLYVKGVKIIDLVLPEDINTISANVFKGCGSIKTLTIPENVVYIGAGAFAECSNLREVYCKSLEPPVLADGSSIICYSPIDFHFTKFYVPYQSLDMYKTAEIWSSYYYEGDEFQNSNFFGYDFENGDVIN